jgi:hypothetical protein
MRLKTCLPLLGLSLLALAACVRTRTQSFDETMQTLDSAGVTVFLLERDLPASIERLGVVRLTYPSAYAGLNKDVAVKRQLITACQRLGANGAYRTNDGFYPPYSVSYLVFRYQK